ncbi:MULTISPECIES: hypothetical protein [Streptomyces]|nr:MULTISPECIES: hypothetical protein [Streptomyces]MBK3520536.1 hypothetical protein [Streptomyces sp. MBT70]GGR59060.1 hypothetical protein GCM10010236_09570 [Streptomyces eurythermus]
MVAGFGESRLLKTVPAVTGIDGLEGAELERALVEYGRASPRICSVWHRV